MTLYHHIFVLGCHTCDEGKCPSYTIDVRVLKHALIMTNDSCAHLMPCLRLMRANLNKAGEGLAVSKQLLGLKSKCRLSKKHYIGQSGMILYHGIGDSAVCLYCSALSIITLLLVNKRKVWYL